MNSTFIKKACGQISDKAQRNLVAAELEAHISDKADYYRELGYDEERDHMLSSPYAAGDTLSDCRKYSKAFYNYTISVMHYRFTGSNGKAEEHIQFWFQTKDGPKPYTFIKRGDGEFYLTDYFIMFRDELKTNNNK